MQTFVRGNVVDITATFTDSTNSGAQPTGASAKIDFPIAGGARDSATIPLTLVGGAGTGQWDSSAAVAGTAEWAVKCSGPLIAAAQGKFAILANRANN
jgi:hypothetical protein